MVRDELSVLSAFMAVAEERSFTRAAKQLNISTSGLSHAIRRLEEQIGVRLLTRTTRSVSTTEAGEQLLAHLRPALADIRGTLTTLSGLQAKAIGRVRLLCPRLAAKTVLAPKLGQFARDYPDVELEVTTDDSRVDLVSAGFDAGIQFGEYIAQDMVAVRVSPDLRPAIVGAPAYFASHPKPAAPREVLQHQCIGFRHRGESKYRWEFDKGGQSMAISVSGSLLVDDLDLIIQAALDGAGLAWVAEDRVEPYLASGALVRVLEDWCPPFPGFFLYYPSRKQQPAALAALIETFRSLCVRKLLILNGEMSEWSIEHAWKAKLARNTEARSETPTRTPSTNLAASKYRSVCPGKPPYSWGFSATYHSPITFAFSFSGMPRTARKKTPLSSINRSVSRHCARLHAPH